MAIKYLWDTNVVVYYLYQQFPAVGEGLIDNLLTRYKPSMSVVTELELLCWPVQRARDRQLIQGFIAGTRVIGLEEEIKLLAVKIRKKHKLKLPDAIIAATAQSYGLTLVSRNTKDFLKVKPLSLLNPFVAPS